MHCRHSDKKMKENYNIPHFHSGYQCSKVTNAVYQFFRMTHLLVTKTNLVKDIENMGR